MFDCEFGGLPEVAVDKVTMGEGERVDIMVDRVVGFSVIQEPADASSLLFARSASIEGGL